jgi:hypothetical protein
MFLKLLKHEFRASFRLLLPMYGGLLLLGLLTRFAVRVIGDNRALTIIGTMSIVSFVIACVAAVILTMVLIIIRFSRSVHGDEGYLTNTLPIGTHGIILSRLVVAFAAQVCTFAVVLLSIGVVALDQENVHSFVRTMHMLFGGTAASFRTGLLRMVGLMIVQSLAQILQIFAAISIGHSFANHKKGFSVLFWFVIYFTEQTVSAVLLSALMTNLLFGSAAAANMSMSQLSGTIILLSVIEKLIVGGVCYLLTWLMMKKHLNLQ